MVTSARRVASIDIGTNSVLLLVAEMRDGELSPVRELATITRLGRGVDARGRLAPDAVAETLSCLQRYADIIHAGPAAVVGAVATSAMRDGSGTAEVLDRVQAILGVRPEIVSGTREAALSFSGALSGLQVGGDVAVLDAGGGSTEIITGRCLPSECEPQLDQSVSLNIGAVRLTERFIRTDPPAKDELDDLRQSVAEALARAPSIMSRTLVGVGGTVTTLAAIELELAEYDADRVHGAHLTRATLARLVRVLASRNAIQRRGLAGVPPRRADIMVAGAVLVAALVAHAAGDQLIVSARGVRWGLAQELTRGD